MAGWRDLRDELRHWADAGRRATLWWRDDDAGPVVPELERLLVLACDRDVPLCLAVVPDDVDEGLGDLLRNGDVAVVQHGLTHCNRAGPAEKKAEFGPHRPVYEMLADVAIGFEGLRQRFGQRHLPVFVPPWNRIADDLVPRLSSARVAALSTFKPRAAAEAAPGLLQVNCHVDPIAWHDGRHFVGTEAALDSLLEHLARRRLGQCDSDEPTGILTHHRIHDDGMWAFLDMLFQVCNASDGAHWLTGAQVFRLPA